MISLKIENQYKELQPELQYVVDVYNSSYEDIPEIVIGYGNTEIADISIVPGNTSQFFTEKQSEPDEFCWFEWRNQKLPLLFQPNDPTRILTRGNGVQINGDILASAFYFLSCWQEVQSIAADHLSRFPAKESFLVRHGILHLPVVNYYFDVLSTAIELTQDERPVPKLSQHQKYSLTAVITHDIDQCKTGWKQETFRALLDKKPGPALSALTRKIFSKDIWFNFDTILRIEGQLEISSTFFFIPAHRKYGKYPNADYKLNSKEIRDIITKILSQNCEVGIHGSLGSGWDSSKFRNDLKKFNHPVVGGRFHYLAISLPESFQVLESSGLHYDTSLGFSEQVGFRNGFCYPFRPYNFETRSAHTFYEFPLALMDWTFIGKGYMNLPPEETYPYIKSLLEEVEKFSGLLVVLWHNNSFSGYKFRGWDKPFLWLINEIKNRNGRFGLPEEIVTELSYMTETEYL